MGLWQRWRATLRRGTPPRPLRLRPVHAALGLLASAVVIGLPLGVMGLQGGSTTPEASASPPPAPPAPAPPPPEAPPPPRPTEAPGLALGAWQLPRGGEVRDGKLVHTVQRKQTLGRLAARYLELTEFYTVKELEQAIFLTNGLPPGKPLSVGQEIVLPGVVQAPAAATRLLYDAGYEARGIYVTAGVAASERIFALLRTLKPLGVNTVVLDVKDLDGILTYRSAVPLAVATRAAERGAHLDLPKLVARLHRQGIYVIARQALFQDRWTARRRPELALHDTRGRPWYENGKLAWVDPANDEVRAYNLALAVEAASTGVDEIQFDYVRFPAMGDLASIGYSFDREKTPKHRIITSFVEAARRALGPSGVTVSLDIYGVVAWGEDVDVERTGQKVEDLAKVADVLSPMLYPSHFYRGFRGSPHPVLEPYHFVHEGVSRIHEKVAPAPVRVRSWLQAFPYRAGNAFDARYIVAQLEASRDARGLGFLLWDPKSQYRVAKQGLALFAGGEAAR